MNAPAAPEPPVSATIPDWSRERPLPGQRKQLAHRLLAAIRGYQHWNARGGLLAAVMKRLHVLRHRKYSALTGADIPLNAQIAGGLALPHPNGIVIAPFAKVGPNCLIFQQVTLGHGGPRPGFPTVGGHVDIGAGAKILGAVTIGDHARIGANAVVLTDVPPGATAVGIPAKIILPKSTPPAQDSASAIP
ncbi:MAG: serine O-acetyltransferase [Phycisphaerae bacterium]|nr:serine acetyltransferase [Tepidisphaeraceae bacterium]